MTESLCPCCQLFGTPVGRVNFLLITGLPWNTIRLQLRHYLLKNLPAHVGSNDSIISSDWQSWIEMNAETLYPTISPSFKKIRPLLPVHKCCRGYSLILQEGFDQTDPFVWNQFKQDILEQLEHAATDEKNSVKKKTELVSWVIVDDKSCLESERIQFFLKVKDEYELRLRPTVTIICVFGTEEQLFENCLLECVNHNEYESSVYPYYQRRIRDFLESFNTWSILRDRTLFIDQSEASRSEQLLTLLSHLPARVCENSHRTAMFRQHVEHIALPCQRRVHAIGVARAGLRNEWNTAITRQLEPLFSDLLNPLKHQSAIRDITQIVLIKFKCMSTEQRRIYEQRVIYGFDERAAQQQRTIAAQLTLHALQSIKQLDELGKSSLPNIVLVLCTLGENRHFSHDFFHHTPEIFTLSLLLVCERQYSIVLAGLRLCKTILDRDRLKHRYAIAYLKDNQDASRKIMDALQWLLTPYQMLKTQWETVKEIIPMTKREDRCLQYAAILVRSKCIQSLPPLLYGSEKHITRITVEDVHRLCDIIDILVDHRLAKCVSQEKPFTVMLVSDLCTVLDPILQYGVSDVIKALRCKTNLLKAIPEAIQILLPYGKELADPCIRFYTMLINSTFKDGKVDYIVESEQFVTKPVMDGLESRRIPNRQDDILHLNQDLIASYFDLNSAYQDVLLQMEEPIIERARKCLDKECQILDECKLHLDYTRLKMKKEDLQEENSRLFNELKHIRSERDDLQDQNRKLIQVENELRLLSLSDSRGTLQSTMTNFSDSNMRKGDDNLSRELANLLPQDISEEQARRFIENIFQRRVAFNDHEMRTSICGSLKQLGFNLYSSPVHFLYELIQNADDNIYSPNVQPCLTFVIDHDFILLSNNEQGLRACDVSAICSLAVSTKKLPEKIGKKGVGFKSVFAASNQPTLVSHAWKFAFSVPGHDEIAYITPMWISDETMLPRVRDRIKREPLNTHLYLPLKFPPRTSDAEDFLDQVVQAVDPYILIHLRQLQKIEIVDERRSRTTLLAKEVIIEEQHHRDKYVLFEGFQLSDITESLVRLENGSQQNSFRIYSAKITVPLITNEKTSMLKTTRITIGFPCDTGCVLTYNVYAGLPVCNLGFNFLVDADFELVTNRESVRENVPSNDSIRNHLSAFFVFLLLNDHNLRKNLDYYCPSESNDQIKHSPWWLIMVYRIHELLQKHIPALLNVDSGKSIRRFDPDLTMLASREDLCRCADIQLVGHDNGIFTDERMKILQIKSVSIIDVLNCFPNRDGPSNEYQREFCRWAQSQNDDWWNTLYHYIDQAMTDELGILLLRKPIFLLQTDSYRQYLPINNTSSTKYCLSDDLTLKMWKRQLILLRYTSQSEHHTLSKIKGVFRLTDTDLIHIIQWDHLQIQVSLQTSEVTDTQVEEVWKDLSYLKTKIDQVHKSDGFYLVPVMGSPRLVPIQDATLPTILGANVQKFLSVLHKHVICFPYAFNLSHDNLEWERFFLKMNCQNPTIYLPDQDTIDCFPILRPFTMVSNVSLAEEIFTNQSLETQQCLREFLILAHAHGRGELYPVSTVFDRSIIRDLPYLPRIDIPPNCLSLAKMLGVICDYDYRACMTVLQVLSDQKNTDLTLYVCWLGHLQLCVRQYDIDDQTLNIASSIQIYLPDHQQFRSLAEIIVLEDHIEHEESTVVVSEYLNLPIVSSSINSIYSQCRDLFRALHCTCNIDQSQLLRTIRLASGDQSNFHALGDSMTVLKETGVEKLIRLYQHLERLILKRVMDSEIDDFLYDAVIKKRHPGASCGSREDLEWRFNLKNANVSGALQILTGLDQQNESLPILTIDHRLVTSINGRAVYACMEEKIIENLAKDAAKRYFILPLITATCPLLLATSNIDYVEQRGKIGWIHKNNNMEQILDVVTKIFRETLDDKEGKIQVVVSKYASVTLYLSDLFPLDSNNDEIPENADRYTFDSYVDFLIFDKTILLCIASNDSSSRKLMIATSALATLLHKRKHMLVEKAKSTAQMKINDSISFSTAGYASFSSSGEAYYSYIDVIFPIENLSIGTNAILLGNQLDSSRPGELMKIIHRRDEELIYRTRIQHQDHRTLKWKDSKTPGASKIVDYQKQIVVGENAEYFFFLYLQKEYGDAYINPVKNWLSSNRRKRFPNRLYGIDDTVGYDLIVEDRMEIFVQGSSGSTKTCYFEVKGLGGPFNVEETRFHVSRNEHDLCESIASNQQRKEAEAYFIVIIEHCLETEKIGLAAVINWSENFQLIRTAPDSYLCHIVPPPSASTTTTTTLTSKPGVYIPPHRRK